MLPLIVTGAPVHPAGGHVRILPSVVAATRPEQSTSKSASDSDPASDRVRSVVRVPVGSPVSLHSAPAASPAVASVAAASPPASSSSPQSIPASRPVALASSRGNASAARVATLAGPHGRIRRRYGRVPRGRRVARVREGDPGVGGGRGNAVAGAVGVWRRCLMGRGRVVRRRRGVGPVCVAASGCVARRMRPGIRDSGAFSDLAACEGNRRRATPAPTRAPCMLARCARVSPDTRSLTVPVSRGLGHVTPVKAGHIVCTPSKNGPRQRAAALVEPFPREAR